MIPGLLLLNKPRGITSFQFLNPIKKKFACKRIGHAGTLDKFAEGLMLVFLGQGTRLVPYFEGLDKVYRAEITFGIETDTLDSDGKIVAQSFKPPPSEDKITGILDQFKGKLEQVPPHFSAIHIHGLRAHERIRRGENFEMPTRTITIHSISLVSYHETRVTLQISCSKGTYIRSIARDIGRELGSFAFLSALQRLQIGNFRSDDALDLNEFNSLQQYEADLRIMTGSELLEHVMHVIRVSEDKVQTLQHGQNILPIDLGIKPSNQQAILGIVDYKDNLIAILEYIPKLHDSTSTMSNSSQAILRYKAVFAQTLDKIT